MSLANIIKKSKKNLKTLGLGLGMMGSLIASDSLAQQTHKVTGSIENVVEQRLEGKQVGLFRANGDSLTTAYTNQNGEFELTYEVADSTGTSAGNTDQIVDKYELSQNYPNPFTNKTTTNFTTPNNSTYTLELFDVVGRRVSQSTQNLSPGTHSFEITAPDATGTYLLRVRGQDVNKVTKMTFVGGQRVGGNPTINLSRSQSTQQSQPGSNNPLEILSSPDELQLKITSPTNTYESTNIVFEETENKDLGVITLNDNYVATTTQGFVFNSNDSSAVSSVDVRKEFSSSVKDAITGENGAYTLSLEVPKRLLGEQASISFTNSLFESKSKEFELGTENVFETYITPLTNENAVSISVLNDAQSNVANAWVDLEVYLNGNWQELASGVTSNQGVFTHSYESLATNNPDSIRVSISKNHYESLTKSKEWSSTLSLNKEIQRIFKNINGNITTPNGGLAANIELYSSSNLVKEAMSQEDGSFSLTYTLADSNHDQNNLSILINEDSGFFEEYASEIEHKNQSLNVELEDVLVNYTVSGNVTNPDSEAVQTTVKLYKQGEKIKETTSTNGSYSFVNEGVPKRLAVKNQDVRVAESDFYKAFVSNGFNGLENKEVNIDLEDKLITSNVNYVISNDEGRVEGATITTLPLNDVGTTNSNGEYSISFDTPMRKQNTLPAQYNITVEADGNEVKETTADYDENLNLELMINRIIPVTNTTFSLNLFEANGRSPDTYPELNALEYFVQAGNEDVQSFTPVNGVVNVDLEHFENVDELKIWHNNSGNHFSYMTILRDPNSEWYENPFNNNMIKNWEHGQPFDTLKVSVADLNGEEFDAYHLPYAFEHSHNGRMLIHGDTLATMMYGRARGGFGIDGIQVGRNMFWNKFENIDKIDYYIMTNEVGTGQPISQEKLDEMIDRSNYILGKYTLENGVKLLEYEKHFVESIQDPIFEQRIEEKGTHNMYFTRRWNILPSNGVVIRRNPETEQQEIRYSRSNYSVNTNLNTITEEIWESMNHTVDPLGLPPGNSSTGYIMADMQGNLNEIGITMQRWKANSSIGTLLYFANPYTQED